ncbi:hypothetical protein PPL_00751 [Heterostelium album PN500]|uniref:Uncharacterized protein n=1 Tax=Heterostelium pallidum (strain ATCC 26659 / Pp 5 / PN500) TaxID=670386 RepID=D3AXC0_HETP5|nr:hypothetical protein PPL_00751 [Heterostelium album PN500]EFA86189.1 hypothetical protein PPL_00751 [Heterostelium album PN500]|eukprot:XP_020438294.1 hypothetical protein PPL_00751 [Heterostelium album PN500]
MDAIRNEIRQQLLDAQFNDSNDSSSVWPNHTQTTPIPPDATQNSNELQMIPNFNPFHAQEYSDIAHEIPENLKEYLLPRQPNYELLEELKRYYGLDFVIYALNSNIKYNRSKSRGELLPTLIPISNFYIFNHIY